MSKYMELTTTSSESANLPRPYIMRISRLTVDKLGVKLYDKVSAVAAELIANGYDADAEMVWVRVPLSTQLARTDENEKSVDSGYVIEIEDDGHGMTPDEAIDFFLKVGSDRRAPGGQGSKSRKKKRPVMGRKGIGKLAPFGICQTIEVYSSGGEKTEQGYLVSHFYMERDKILQDTDEDIEFERGKDDRTYRQATGTRIRLSNFLPKRVPDEETFHRQLAARFTFARPDFQIIVEDIRNPENHPLKPVSPLSIPIFEGTRIDLDERPLNLDTGETLAVTGWLGMAKQAYKNEEMAGVRIYARDKIVATTRDFEQPAGFTGEFTMRSYLVGEVNAEWLDLDEGEDLIRTDRQGILWDSDYGQALKKWGAELIKEIGRKSAQPRRERTRAMFLQESDIERLAREKFTDEEVIDVAIDLAKQIGGFAAEDELKDKDYVDGLSNVILSVAPHKALIETFQEFNKAISGNDVSLDKLLDLFNKTRIAEMASYSQIAAERVKVIRELEKIVISQNVDESEFQNILADAPWLIEPTWSVISKNQTLKTFKKLFEAHWKKKTGQDITLAIGFETKRPDFTLVSVGSMLHIVEIKKSGYTFTDSDFSRLVNYVYAFREFFTNNSEISKEFPRGWRIDLIADAINLIEPNNRELYSGFEQKGEIKKITWDDFLNRAIIAHELFLNVNDQFAEYTK